MNHIDNTMPVDLAHIVVPPLPPQPRDTRGYLYIVKDANFPKHFKFGLTINMDKRIVAYDTDKPYPTCTVFCVSALLKDAKTAESMIKRYMAGKLKGKVSRQEWYPLHYISTVESLIQQIEQAKEVGVYNVEA